jgi:hypothetical protein
MWEAIFNDELSCWVVQTRAGYPLLEGEWEGLLRVTDESNARLIAAVLSADEEGKQFRLKDWAESGIQGSPKRLTDPHVIGEIMYPTHRRVGEVDEE